MTWDYDLYGQLLSVGGTQPSSAKSTNFRLFTAVLTGMASRRTAGFVLGRLVLALTCLCV